MPSDTNDGVSIYANRRNTQGFTAYSLYVANHNQAAQPLRHAL